MTAPAVLLTVPSLLILGTDAVLAAGPATPVQLAHACLAAGFHAVIPASWGDELIAARVIERLRDADGPRVQCSCPHVAKRLCEHGDAIAPMLLHFVPPAVATAQYLRAAYAPARPHITYAGDCPSAADECIDVWLSVEALMQTFVDRAISLPGQPTEFDSVIPPDRRRHFSDPGGVPSRHVLRQLSTPVEFVELRGDDVIVDLAQQLLAESRSLIDASTQLGCCCSGAIGNVSPEAARARVREQEPPRSTSPVVDHSLRIEIEFVPAMFNLTSPAASPRAFVPHQSKEIGLVADEAALEIDTVARRRSPVGMQRPVLGATPLRRSEGRQLPRAFVARRRSSPRGGLRQSFLRATHPSRFRLRTRWIWIAAGALAVSAGIALLVRFVL